MSPPIERLADAVLSLPDAVALADAGDADLFRRRDGRRMRVDAEALRYSTTELLALEQRIMAAAEQGRERGRATVDPTLASTALSSRPSLSDEQQEMVSALATRGDAVAVVAGRAGTGKT